MDPLMDYYLCATDGETTMVAAYRWEEEALDGCDSVQRLPYWQALQLTLALVELDRTPVRTPELFPLAIFMDASEELIEELLGREDRG